ncbi:hypothetical protein VTK26DRAFT_8102 [Humicola hyalothermophila]
MVPLEPSPELIRGPHGVLVRVRRSSGSSKPDPKHGDKYTHPNLVVCPGHCRYFTMLGSHSVPKTGLGRPRRIGRNTAAACKKPQFRAEDKV